MCETRYVLASAGRNEAEQAAGGQTLLTFDCPLSISAPVETSRFMTAVSMPL